MHGELEAQLPSGLSADAGIVPRVITRLFQRLERDYADYAVSISCMEIYNEELRDLLASQPLNGVTPRNLKIFEHPQSRGTLVQGLLEIPVKDVKTAIEVLRRGSAHRHVASTNFNKNSSRSHSLFTVSVTAASSSTDMFQIGKLNLVDLAGSEDIGRSGAENVQAKEAGLINKSLLTLGRVINALVEKSEKPNTHIPYRFVWLSQYPRQRD
jgi:kinesin family protein 11